MNADNDDYKDVSNPYLRYAMKQGVTQFLLISILGVMLYLGVWIIQIGVPAHLKQIQAGYRESDERHAAQVLRITERHADSLKKMEEQHTKEIEALIDAFEKGMDQPSSKLTAQ